MITADALKTLTSFTAPALNRAARDNGYTGPAFASSRFLGITNGGQFCYQAQFLINNGKDGTGNTKVFLTYNHAHGSVTADTELTHLA